MVLLWGFLYLLFIQRVETLYVMMVINLTMNSYIQWEHTFVCERILLYF
jgi:hypothetical protein